MNTPHQLPLQWQIKPSRILKQTLLLLHCLAVFTCWVSAISLAVKISITILIAYTGQKIYRGKTVFDQCYWLHYSHEMGWELADRELNYQAITILSSTVITQWLSVIHFQTTEQQQRWQSLVVIKDSLTPEKYRQLIVKLRVIGSK